MTKKMDLKNMLFGKLTVIGPADSGFWWCRCECGRDNLRIKGYSLTSGNTQSCGCLRRGPRVTRLPVKEVLAASGYVKTEYAERVPKPRPCIAAEDIMEQMPGITVELLKTLKCYGVKFRSSPVNPAYPNAGVSYSYSIGDKTFGYFITPIQALGHLMYYAIAPNSMIKQPLHYVATDAPAAQPNL